MASEISERYIQFFTLFWQRQSPKTAEERDHMALVPYASAVCSLMYAMVFTRPEIAHAVGVVSRYMANSGKEHWEAVKWLLRYLRGTSSTSLCFGKGKVTLQGFLWMLILVGMLTRARVHPGTFTP